MSSASELTVGSRVTAQGNSGTIRFMGSTSFAPGKWFGVELDEAVGKNSGSVNGRQYFACKPNHGVFFRVSQIKVIIIYLIILI
jgi:dynactin 1